MTKQEAKSIPLSILLEKMGFQASRSKHSGNDMWYKSPFRPLERDTNFHVNTRENVWFDFGSNQGGDTLKFIKEFNKTDETEALIFLDALFPKAQKKDKLHDGKKRFDAPETLTLKRAQPISNPHLIAYLTEDRKIDLNTAQKHLVEVIYSQAQTGKDFYALGMANRLGGFEIRNKYFKGSIFKKDISILSPKAEDMENKVSIFHSFFDFLSASKYYGATLTEGEVIVMHSNAFQNSVLAYLNARSFSRIFTYFDNDRAGEELTYAIGKQFAQQLEPCNALYYPHKDFNAFWVKKMLFLGH
ncbi:MAG: toprim domain-containing protein [Saprospiraceae bacterium]|nr:toprim domain-containing protein [Saprospiraceae bacterium]